MEIAARGWRRDAGKKTIVSQEISEALPATNNVYEPDRLYIDPTEPGLVRLLAGPVSLTLGGDYQIEVRASVQDLLRLLLAKFPEIKAEFAPIFEKKEKRLWVVRGKAAIERNDPEASYRRGYEQGAREAMRAMQQITSRPRALMVLSTWIEHLIYEWRYHGPTTDRTVKPPSLPYDPQLKDTSL
jgi:hypothetical protein